MSVTDGVTAPNSPGAAAPSAAPPSVAYPADYEELRERAQRYDALNEQLSPYAEVINRLVTDEDYRTFTQSATETYDERLKRQQPQVPAEFQPVVDRFEKELGPLVEFVNETKREREERIRAEAADKEAQIAAAQRANVEYAQRLAAERPDLAEDNYAGIGMLAAYAANRGLSLEDAYKATGSRFGAPPKKATPPTSLRGDSAAPGVPGESTQPPIKSTTDLRKRLAANLRAGGMKG